MNVPRMKQLFLRHKSYGFGLKIVDLFDQIAPSHIDRFNGEALTITLPKKDVTQNRVIYCMPDRH